MKKMIILITLIALSVILIATASIWQYGNDGDQSLVLDMDFDGGSLLDDSVYGNNGAITGDVTPTNKGRFGQAFEFDGNGDFITVPGDASLNFESKGFSISLWIRPKSLSSPDAPAIMRLWKNVTRYIALRVAYLDELEFRVNGGNGSLEVNSVNNAIDVNKWYHVTAVYNPTGTSFVYINGNQSGTGNAGNVGNTSTSGPLNIAVGPNGGAWAWNGTLDEIKIYNRSLTASEVRELYNESKVSHTFKIRGSGDRGLINDSGLVGLWHLDGDASDSSGQGNDGTITGAVVTNKGRFGQAYEFDGSSDYVTVPHSSTIFNFSNGITVCAWTNKNDVSNGMIISKDTSTVKTGWRMYMGSDGDFYLQAGTGTAWSPIQARWITTYSTNTWYFVCGLAESNGNIFLYVDGDYKDNHSAVSSDFLSTTSDLIIGDDAAENLWFNGTIDEVRIYNKSLSASEVLELYNESLKSNKFVIKGRNATNVSNVFRIRGNPNG